MLGVLVLGSVWLLLSSRDLWFYSDIWPSLGASIGSLEDLNRSHGGHWQLTNVVTVRLLHTAFGMEFWPWFLLPRVVLYGGFALAWWRIARWRGTAPVQAFAFFLVVLFLATSGWIVSADYSGAVIGHLCALGAAVIMQCSRDGRSYPVIMFGLLTLALMSTASSTALWLAVAVVVALSGSWRKHIAPLAGSLAVYLLWYWQYGRDTPDQFRPKIQAVSSLVDLPGDAFVMLRTAMENLLGTAIALPESARMFPLSEWVGALGLIVLVAAFAYAYRRGALAHFEAVLFLTGALLIVVTVTVRADAGFSVTAASRTHLVTVYLVLPVLAALVRVVPRRFAALSVACLLILATVNAIRLEDNIDVREAVRTIARSRIETAAALVAAGEPALPWTAVSPQAHVQLLQDLVDDGWQPQVSSDVDLRSDIGARLRMAVPLAEPPPQGVLRSPDSRDGCVTVQPGQQLDAVLAQSGFTRLVAQPGDTFTVRWLEPRGRYERAGAVPADGTATLAFAVPDADTRIELTGSWASPAELCGFAEVR